MKRLKWVVAALAGIVALLALVPLVVSLEDYVPQIEAAVSERLGEPVDIGSLRAGGLPLPHVSITAISIGKSDDLRVGKVTVAPDLWSLLGDTKVIRSIEIEQLVLTQQAIDRIAKWTKTDPDAPAAPPVVRIGEIRLSGALLRLEQAAIGPFDARIRLTEDGRPASASLKTADGRLEMEAVSEAARYRIDARAKGWTVPVHPALHFDELLIKGAATLERAELGDIRARLYGGTVSGKLTAAWTKGLRIEGAAEVDGVQIAPVLQALRRPPTLSGRLNAKPVQFSAAAAAPAGLVAALRLETPFDVQDGVLHGVDVSKAATSMIGGDGGRGGQTRFDLLSGQLLFDRGMRRITRIQVASGSLSADGHVTISRSDELKGRINANLKAARLAAATIPLNVSGTLEEPRLLPTRGTVAGAAVGTAILGPGVGTTIGSKIGQWTEGLFGGRDEEK